MSVTMYDGINSDAAAIARKFPHAAVVAGYVNGKYAWSQADWNLFPHASHVTISVTASADAGDVLDVEAGDATPGETAGWIGKRKASGLYRPSIYCSRSAIPAVRQGTGRYILGRDYDIWVADWTGSPHEVTAPGSPSARCAVTQYQNASDHDVSAVYDTGWPHRRAPTAPPPAVTPPAEPAGVHATSVSATSVSLAWNSEAAASSYRIRATYQGAVVRQATSASASVTVSGLTPHHTYTFHVAAVNAKGTSAETSGPTVTTPR